MSPGFPSDVGPGPGDAVDRAVAPGLVCDVLAQGGCVHITLSGELDIATADQLWEVVERCLRGGCHGMVLDLADLTFLDAGGLRVLVRMRRQLVDGHGTLTLTHLQPLVRRVVSLTDLTEYLGVQPASTD